MEKLFQQNDLELWEINDWQEFRNKAKGGHLDLDIHSTVYPTVSEKFFLETEFFLIHTKTTEKN
jgi:hypothetical protein